MNSKYQPTTSFTTAAQGTGHPVCEPAGMAWVSIGRWEWPLLRRNDLSILYSLTNQQPIHQTQPNSCSIPARPSTTFKHLEGSKSMSEGVGGFEAATDTVDLPAIPSPATISTHSLSLPQLPPTIIEREGSLSSAPDGMNELNGSGSNTPNFGEGDDEVDSMDEAEEALEHHELSAFGLVGAEDDGLPPPPKPDGGKGEKKGPHNSLSAAARAKRPSKNIKVRLVLHPRRRRSSTPDCTPRLLFRPDRPAQNNNTDRNALHQTE